MKTKIYPQVNWPRVQCGTYKVRFPAHSLIVWLSRWLPITPYIEGTYTKYRDADPILMSGKIFCSYAQYQYLRQKL